jgi:hypothetical protein
MHGDASRQIRSQIPTRHLGGSSFLVVVIHDTYGQIEYTLMVVTAARH